MFEWNLKGPKRTQSKTTQAPDGSTRQTWEFAVGPGELRPVRDDAVEAFDAVLGAHGEVMHLMDPTRIQTFAQGGPPVWSVAYVRVDGPAPYWLLLTYGFSHVLSPEASREAYAHEYSIAVPAHGDQPPRWAHALLSNLARYVLQTGAELKVGDNVPLMQPITRWALSPDQKPSAPDTALDTILVGVDPVLGPIATPHGAVPVRRFVGVLPNELERVQTWNCTGFLEEWAAADPRLATDPNRTTVLTGALAVRCDARAREEGGSVGLLYLDGGWRTVDGTIEIALPGGESAAQIRRVLEARLPFGRELVLRGPPHTLPIVFVPESGFGLHPEAGGLFITGAIDDPNLQEHILRHLHAGSPGAVLRFR